MPELKTKKNNASIKAFIDAVPHEGRRADAKKILTLMKRATGERPKMWGTSIIGFGSYHYKSERSSQEGDWPMVGFSPRKQNLVLYIMPGFSKYKSDLKKLGPHKTGSSCLYLGRLDSVDLVVLGKLVHDSYTTMKKKYG